MSNFNRLALCHIDRIESAKLQVQGGMTTTSDDVTTALSDVTAALSDVTTASGDVTARLRVTVQA